ncbi:MAG: DUF3810 family protein [Candidatus Baltobacteraceae bacterium]
MLAGILAASVRPSAKWVEQSFSNGYYPGWEHFWSSFTAVLPFALGDVIALAGIAAALGALLFVRPWWRALLGIAALAGCFVFWFYAGWGFGYDRAPLEARTAFSPDRVNDRTIDALRAQAATEVNLLAAPAHRANAAGAFDLQRLNTAWLPVAQRLGDAWTPHVAAAKPTLAGAFMDLNGTTGFTNPFSLETQLAPDLLWFERPFTQAHEWSHAAGFNREDEANYIGLLACLRDGDVVAQYSGWLELFLYLPRLQNYPHKMFTGQVWADFAALRKRNAHFVNLNFSRFSWHVYNSYLQSNHIASGVRNYDEVTRLLAGIPLDAAGLPATRADIKR